MNCFKSSVKPVQNEIFDLMDMDGDNIITKDELSVVSRYVLDADMERARVYLEGLRAREPVKYVIGLLGTQKVYKRHLKVLYPKLHHDVWVEQVLPALRKKELERLSHI